LHDQLAAAHGGRGHGDRAHPRALHRLPALLRGRRRGGRGEGMTTRAASGTGPGPVVGPAIRDLLEHPIPLIVANAVWGVLVFVAWTAWLVSPGAGFAATILLAWPAAAVAGVAGRIVRGGPVGIRDALAWP